MKKLKTFLLALFIGLIVTGCGCEKQKFTVSFDSNGGSAISSQTVEKDGTVSKPANPTKEGYTFEGWYLNDQAYNFSLKVTTNFTLKAKWSDNSKTDADGKFTITFSTDGGSTVTSLKVEPGQTISAPTAPTKDGYTFEGWYVDGKKYDFSTKVTKSITLTAKWAKKESSSSSKKSSSSSKKSSSKSSAKSSSKTPASSSQQPQPSSSEQQPVAVTYSCEWGNNAVGAAGQYMLYIKGSDGAYHAGTVSVNGKEQSIPQSGKAFVKAAVSSCNVVSAS